jgi:hypothetical protein
MLLGVVAAHIDPVILSSCLSREVSLLSTISVSRSSNDEAEASSG